MATDHKSRRRISRKQGYTDYAMQTQVPKARGALTQTIYVAEPQSRRLV